MHAILKLGAVLACILLSSCTKFDPELLAQNAALQDRTAKLQQQLDAQEGTRRDDRLRLEAQAGIAAGCDVLIKLCPESIAAPGRQAQVQGLGGGGTWQYWSIFMLKLMTLAIAAGAAVGTGAWLWARAGQPAAEKSEQARQLIADATELEVAAKIRASRAADDATEAENRAISAKRKLAELKEALQTAQNSLQAAQSALDNTTAARAALSAFSVR